MQAVNDKPAFLYFRRTLFLLFCLIARSFAQLPNVPLGTFVYLNGIFAPLSTPAPAANPSNQINDPALSRKLADNGSPADTAFEMACAGPTSDAAINCPCAGIGHRCADPASVCSATRKCICDGALGYLDSTGTKCVTYPTTTTSTSAPCPSCPALTCPTTTSTTSTTTSTTSTSTTTTKAPTTTCTAAGAVVNSNTGYQQTTCGACVELTSTSKTVNINGVDNKDSVCAYTFIAPAGSSVQIDFDLPNFDLLTCKMGTFIVIAGSQYCNDKKPPATLTIPTSIVTLIYFDQDQQFTNSLILKAKVAS
ncbi:integumentary mucin C.1-like [Paramacrobiotus metropolitanus]|uniref:integumentary mucin C.1-like n=1 Tax=Paramacrobiotus metropolitanus TaxID=2943436 RepID=UPI002445FF1B|nr:integumentary mucin C.1-like [Paramacrobiotus metropolitanus]